MENKVYEQKLLGDIRGVSVYLCKKCNSRIYGDGSYCRKCGAKLKENKNNGNKY